MKSMEKGQVPGKAELSKLEKLPPHQVEKLVISAIEILLQSNRNFQINEEITERIIRLEAKHHKKHGEGFDCNELLRVAIERYLYDDEYENSRHKTLVASCNEWLDHQYEDVYKDLIEKAMEIIASGSTNVADELLESEVPEKFDRGTLNKIVEKAYERSEESV